MLDIVFETHATSVDNEAHIASGWFDAPLSALGERQAIELGSRYATETFAAVLCSDLQRSFKTADIAFGSRFLILKDARFRECDYGDLTRGPVDVIEAERCARIHSPFPNGESYAGVAQRTADALSDAASRFGGAPLLIVGHRATYFALEHLLRGVRLEDVIASPWEWRPGWRYSYGDHRRTTL